MENTALKSTPNNSVPHGAIVEEIMTRDRVRLRTAMWHPTGNLGPDGKPVGTICLFQGRSEFIEKYYEVIQDLRRRGFVVATLDWRGQGLSDRRFRNRFRGHVNRFGLYHRDLEAFIYKLILPKCPAPYFALAHSLGGHVLFSASAGGLAKVFERIILTAPMLHLAPRMLLGWHWLRGGKKKISNKIISQRPTRLATGLLRLLGFGWAFVPGGSDEIIHPFSGNLITSDETRFDRSNELLAAHPQLGLGSPTNAWVHSACRSMRRVLKPAFIRKVDVPMVIVASGSDQVVSTLTIEKISSNLRVGHQIVIRGARHEIMFERNELRSQFWAIFDAFIPGSDVNFKADEARGS